MKSVLIVGGSRGIGAEMVRAFSSVGAHVAFTYASSHEAAQALAAECGAHAICADARDERASISAVEEASRIGGAPDVLICNAAISSFSLLTDLTYQAWRDTMAVNLDSAFLYAKAVLPAMIREKYGRIITISSMWGQTGASCEVHYSASKAGLIGFTRALAKEVAPSGITVNCIAPGVIDTDMNRMLTADERAALCAETPLGRFGTPEEIASAALFLASEEAAFITGQVLGVNGGFVI